MLKIEFGFRAESSCCHPLTTAMGGGWVQSNYYIYTDKRVLKAFEESFSQGFSLSDRVFQIFKYWPLKWEYLNIFQSIFTKLRPSYFNVQPQKQSAM